MRRTKTISAAEQVALCRRAQAGDLAARNALVTATMGLVYSIAKRWVRSAHGLELDDLAAEGVFGLLKAMSSLPLRLSHASCEKWWRAAICTELREASCWRQRKMFAASASDGTTHTRQSNVGACDHRRPLFASRRTTRSPSVSPVATNERSCSLTL